MAAKLTSKARMMHAAQILENPVWQDAFDVLRAAYLAQITNTLPDETEARERAYFAHKAVGEVQAALTAFVENGKLDEHQAKKQKKANG